MQGKKTRIPGERRLARQGKAEFLQLLRPQKSPLLNIQFVARPSRPAYQKYKKEARKEENRCTRWLKSTRAIPKMSGSIVGWMSKDSGRAFRDEVEANEEIDMASSGGGFGG
jgi:hypothetical protein